MLEKTYMTTIINNSVQNDTKNKSTFTVTSKMN